MSKAIFEDKVTVLPTHAPPVQIHSAPALKTVTLPKLRLSVYKQEVARAELSLDNIEILVENDHRLEVVVFLKNEDGQVAHSADVKLSLIDSNGNVMCTETRSTGMMAAGGPCTLSYHFEHPNILNKYASHWISISQRS